MGQYTSYYLYQRYEQREGQDPIPCTPNVYSIDGYGTKQRVVKMENDPDCGYVPPTPTEPTYRWYEIPITEDYICASCGISPTGETMYRWVDDGFTCQGYDKWLQEKEQASTDGGTTWTDTGVVSATTLAETNSSYCGYVPPTPPSPTGGTKLTALLYDGTSYYVDCDSSSAVTSADTQNYVAVTSYSPIASVAIGDCVTSIDSNAFQDCTSLTSVTIPNSVTNIGNYSFNCPLLTSIDLPSSVTSIGDGAFSDCRSLSTLTIDAITPPALGSYAFYGTTFIYVPCESINAYKTASGWSEYENRIRCDTPPTPSSTKFYATYNDSTTFSAECDSSSVLTSATTMAHSTSYTAMTSAVIGDCVTKIDINAFFNIDGQFTPSGMYFISLTSVTIPDSVTEIGSSAFYGCSGLTSVNIPSGVTSIGRNTFQGCSSLTSVVIPDSVTTLGDYIFTECTNLTSVSIGSGLTALPRSTFSSCSSLTNVVIPNNIIWIYDEAFRGCTSLASVSIGSGVTRINKEVFWGCTNLSSITINSTVPPTLGTRALSIDYDNRPNIYVPCSSVETYKAASGWGLYKDNIYGIPPCE